MNTNRQILDEANKNGGEFGYNEVVAQVDFRLSEHPNPKKARRKNIKRAMKALRPTKRSIFNPRRWLFRNKYLHTKTHECVIDGTNCLHADYGDLFDQYFRDPVTLEIEPFSPWSGVVQGRGHKLKGTYCPQHMMLYHRMMEWIEQEENEADPGFFTKMAKQGVALVPVRRQGKEPEHPLIVKWTPIFKEAMKDGIQILHYQNPITKENDITMLVFDNRVLQHTAPTGNMMRNMDMKEYYEVIQQMEKN